MVLSILTLCLAMLHYRDGLISPEHRSSCFQVAAIYLAISCAELLREFAFAQAWI